jgi:CheY-like chemotaxis protein
MSAEAAREAVTTRKVLLAEDSPVTQDLLKLLLNQRGHHVDTVTDGWQAFEALRKNDYDVALLDFHLPNMNGAEVAAGIRRGANGRRLPQLVAITADIEGLLASPNSEQLDHIIAKPLDIYEVGKLIEDQADIGARRAVEPSAPAPQVEVSRAPAKLEPSFFEGHGYEFLTWPEDIGTSRVSARAVQASLADPRFDAILIKEQASKDDLSLIWRRKALFALPVIDLTGTLGTAADLDGSKLSTHDVGRLDNVIRAFRDQRARLSRDLLLSDDLGEQLVGRVFVSGRPLTPVYDPSSRGLIAYDTVLPGKTVALEAESLCGQGLLARDFFDRLHVCARCDSARVHVREECMKCHSANLVEEPYLHHFKCAFQGPESQFRRGDDLICPKCRRELSHFGFDYDRPGTMLVCQACGHAASEPAVGFVCLDCGAHADSETCPTRDVFAYRLTEEGAGFAQYGQSFLGHARQALRFTDLPIELAVALNAAAKAFNETKTPFALVDIFYQNEREVTAEHGARQFAQARDLFLQNLRAALGAPGLVVKGPSYDFVLLRGSDPGEVREQFAGFIKAGERALRLDLGVTFQVFGPEDFS